VSLSAQYAPYPLDTNSTEAGFTRTELTTDLGVTVIHHKRTSSSTRATLFLHGAAGSWTTWTPMLTTADASDAPIENPILLDLPGWGAATLTADPNSIDLEAGCAVVKECAEELGYTEWDVVGHSMGGFIALHMGALWPQNVMSIGVISATGRSIVASVGHPLRNFSRVPAFTLLWKGMSVLTALGFSGARLIRLVRRLGLMRWFVSPLFRFPRRIDASVINALGTELRPRPFTIAARLVRGYTLEEHWSAIQCPVRAVGGDSDVFSPVDDLRHLASVIPTSQVAILEDCGHFAAIERPHQVLSALGYHAPV
jgi:pimeloyl-ACP methyl ester carboxylesterase